MSTDLETRDRATLARLAEAGIRGDSGVALTFRLLTVDRLTPAQVAATLGIAEATVHSRVSRVRARLLAAEDAHQRGETAPATVPDDEDGDPVTEAARLLLELVRNRDGEAGGENPVGCDPLLSVADARGVILEAEARRAARFCP